MKKILATLLIAAMALSFAACGSDKKETAKDPAKDTPAVEDTTDAATDDTVDAVVEDTDEVTEDIPAEGDEIVSIALINKFEELAADSSLDAQAIADGLLTTDVLASVGMMGTMPIEDTYLSGFDNYEVKGFTECVMFSPMIGTIPFVGYVFTIGDGVDAQEFVSELEANANLRWNICTEADTMASDIVGDKVMFVMCPNSFEQDVPEEEMPMDEGIGDMGIEEIPAYDPDVMA